MRSVIAPMRTEPLRIDGERIDPGAWLEVTQPYDGAVCGQVAAGDGEHAEAAVTAAAQALAEGPPPQHRRAGVLEAARDLVHERRDALAALIAAEAGKPLRAALSEVSRCADTLTFAAVEARRLTGTMVPYDGSTGGHGKLGFTLRRPAGVAVAITPFNFPLNLVAHKVAPAFAAGCPVVLKPASATPLTAYAFAELLADAGMPAGFLHVVTGSSTVLGPALTARDEVAVISFTGSAEVGHALVRDNPGKRVLTELGNTTPVVVDASADVEAAARKIAMTGYAHAGQSCISVQRVLAHTAVHDHLCERLAARVERLTVGDPSLERTDVGPLITAAERDRVAAWIAAAVTAGATALTGGDVNDDGTLQPAVVDQVPTDVRLWTDEVFGPVVGVRAVADLDEAIALANDSRYGLQAGIFTGDLDAALTAAHQLRFGGVMVNESPTFRADQQPYGGLRDSGNTREGPAWAIDDYLEETVVAIQR